MRKIKREFVLTLPHLPPPELFPNALRSLHWAVRSNVEKASRDEAGWIAKMEWHDKPMEKVEVTYLFTQKDKRVRDTEALVSAAKPFLDGMIDVGVLMSDSGKYLSIAGAKVIQGDKNETLITIKEV